MSTVYLLGAGFTHAVLGNVAPLNDEVIGRLKLRKYSELETEYGQANPSIEQFLTLLDLKLARAEQRKYIGTSRLRKIRKKIIERIVDVFSYERLYIDDLDQKEVLKKFVLSLPTPALILTLNYDCVLDQALWYSGRWSPYDGYGIRVPSDEEELSTKNIRLFKLHGSVNFKERSDDQEYPFVEINNKLFPGAFSERNKRGSSHIIAMNYIKAFRNGLMRFWRDAIVAMREAEHLIIIGCSLRDEDTFLRFLLYNFGMKKSCDTFKIDIVDKGKKNANAIKKKVEGLVACPKLQKISTHDKGLEHYLSNK